MGGTGMAPFGDAGTYEDAGTFEDVADTAPLPQLAGAGKRRRFRRLAYRATLTIASLVACLLIAFGGLLLLTPSASPAPKLAAAFAPERRIPHPAPPPPPSL